MNQHLQVDERALRFRGGQVSPDGVATYLVEEIATSLIVGRVSRQGTSAWTAEMNREIQVGRSVILGFSTVRSQREDGTFLDRARATAALVEAQSESALSVKVKVVSLYLGLVLDVERDLVLGRINRDDRDRWTAEVRYRSGVFEPVQGPGEPGFNDDHAAVLATVFAWEDRQGRRTEKTAAPRRRGRKSVEAKVQDSAHAAGRTA